MALKAMDPLSIQYEEAMRACPPAMNRLFDPSLDEQTRKELFEWNEKHQFRLRREFAYAVPSHDALAILSSLSPVVEIGAGTGYWASLLRARGATVYAYDIEPNAVGAKDLPAGSVPLMRSAKRAKVSAAAVVANDKSGDCCDGDGGDGDGIEASEEGTVESSARQGSDGGNEYHPTGGSFTQVSQGGPEAARLHPECRVS